MKKILVLSFLTIFIFKFSEANEKRTFIAGKLEGCKIQNVTIFNRYDVRLSETPDSLGRVEFRLDEGSSGYYTIRMGSLSFNIYVESGDSCYFQANCELDSVFFSGTNKRINNYLLKKDEIINAYLYDTDSFVVYKKSIDSLYLILSDYHKTAIDDNIRNSFLELDKLEIECFSMNNLIEGSFYFEYKIDDSFLYINDINNLDYYKISPNYRKFVLEYLFLKASDKTEKNKLIHRYEVASELLKEGEIKDFVLTDFFESILKVCNDDEYNFSDLFKSYKENCFNENKINNIKKIYEEKALLAKGTVIPQISLTNHEGGITNLSSFAGSYLYLFIYSPHCGTCKDEIEDFKLVQSLYENENIEFIAIAMGTNFDEWQQFIKDNGLIGTQLLAQGKDHGELIQKFMIKYPPTFILIDDNQKIINMRAPKPSDGIDKLLDSILDIKN